MIVHLTIKKGLTLHLKLRWSEDATVSGGWMLQMPIALWRKHVLRQSVWEKGILSMLGCCYRDLCTEDKMGGYTYQAYLIFLKMVDISVLLLDIDLCN